ncbi:hypothetical protein ACFOU2_16930 [Bacillus songklensis]|uniref:Uncharacterized protein n=2 Tax=Bacillus songklensis TaxID=1069116 RepID=A0ABV8B789_9BACI
MFRLLGTIILHSLLISSPSLTTVGQEVYEIGNEAADVLIEMLEGKSTNMQRYLKTNLNCSTNNR